jgi:hypothetical protein
MLTMTALFVGGLAIVAGAVSFAHMQDLATHHDQLGWKSYAFPISVDGLEIVASLYLVAQRRAGRPTGWIPWVALIVGTAASLAANVAVGGADPIQCARFAPAQGASSGGVCHYARRIQPEFGRRCIRPTFGYGFVASISYRRGSEGSPSFLPG